MNLYKIKTFLSKYFTFEIYCLTFLHTHTHTNTHTHGERPYRIKYGYCLYVCIILHIHTNTHTHGERTDRIKYGYSLFVCVCMCSCVCVCVCVCTHVLLRVCVLGDWLGRKPVAYEMCLWSVVVTAFCVQDRKVIIKGLKGHIVKVCKDEAGHMVLLAIFDSVDDTVLVQKAILDVSSCFHSSASAWRAYPEIGCVHLHFLAHIWTYAYSGRRFFIGLQSDFSKICSQEVNWSMDRFREREKERVRE